MDDCIVCVLRNGFTAHEQTIADGGDMGRVIEMRQDFQRLMESEVPRSDREHQEGHRPMNGAALLASTFPTEHRSAYCVISPLR